MNEFKITGKLSYGQIKFFETGSCIYTAQLSIGNKEKGYHNFRIKAFKENAEKMSELQDGQFVELSGWLSQDRWEKNGVKNQAVILNVKEFAKKEFESKPVDGDVVPF